MEIIGKSLLLKLIAEIMGPLMTYGNILAVNDKFALEPVMKGIANVTDDVGITTIKETGLIKSLVDGGKVEVNRKFKGSVWWQPTSQFIMCCNEIPRIQDTTNGMVRRLGFIPFELHLKEEDVDRTLFYKMKSDVDNLRYLMSGGIYAFREAHRRGNLTKLDKQDELTKDFIEENQDPISVFYDNLINEHNSVGSVCRYLNGRTTDEIYNNYKKWCEDSGISPERPKTFTMKFSRQLPICMKKKVMSIGGSKFNSYIIEGKIPNE